MAKSWQVKICYFFSLFRSFNFNRVNFVGIIETARQH